MANLILKANVYDVVLRDPDGSEMQTCIGVHLNWDELEKALGDDVWEYKGSGGFGDGSIDSQCWYWLDNQAEFDALKEGDELTDGIVVASIDRRGAYCEEGIEIEERDI